MRTATIRLTLPIRDAEILLTATEILRIRCVPPFMEAPDERWTIAARLAAHSRHALSRCEDKLRAAIARAAST